MSSQVSTAFVGKDELTPVVRRIDDNLGRLERRFDSVRGRLTTGLFDQAGARAFDLLERGIRRVVDAIPDLVGRGRDWLSLIDDIGDATGMSARQASTLAAIQQDLGGSTDSLGRSLAFMSKTVVNNEGAFKRQGIATRDANGRLLDAGALFENVRRKTSALGASQRTTAIATNLLGRSSKDLIDILVASPAEYARMAAAAEASGRVVGDAAVAANERWQRALGRMGGAITGVGAQVAGSVAPVLERLVNGITATIQANLASISEFVTRAVSTISGVVGGLLGTSFELGAAAEDSVPSFQKWRREMEQMGGAADETTGAVTRGTTAIDRRVAAIDRQLAAMDKAGRAEDARRQREQAMADVREARRELESIRGETILASRMGEADAVLARQDKAARMAEASKRVREAERQAEDAARASRQQRRREALQAERDALSRHASARRGAAPATSARQTTRQWRDLYDEIYGGHGKGDKPTALERHLARVAKSSIAAGRKIADAIQDAIFGPDTSTFSWKGGHIQVGVKREGGLISVLQNVGDALGKLAGLMGPNTGALLELGVSVVALKGLYGPLAAVLRALGGTPTPTPTPTGTGGSGGGSFGFGPLGMVTRVLGPAAMLPDAANSFKDRVKRDTGLDWDQYKDFLSQRESTGMTLAQYKAWVAGGRKPQGNRAKRRAVVDMSPSPVGGSAPLLPGSQGLGGFGAWNPIFATPGGGMGDPTFLIRNSLRPFLGDSSPIVKAGQDTRDAAGAAAEYGAQTAGNTGATASNTGPLTAPLGVTNNSFAAIGKVERWNAGMLGVQNNAFIDIGSIKKATIKIPVRIGKGDAPGLDPGRDLGRGHYSAERNLDLIRMYTEATKTQLHWSGSAAKHLYNISKTLDRIAGGKARVWVSLTSSTTKP